MTPLGMDGIAPDGTRILLCGLSYRQLVSCAGMGQKEAAAKLGVNYSHFNQLVKRMGLSHWWPKPKQTFTRCLTKEDIIATAAEGYTMKDAAFVLEVSERYFKKLVADWGLAGHFPNSGKAAWISRKGYCQ